MVGEQNTASDRGEINKLLKCGLSLSHLAGKEKQ